MVCDVCGADFQDRREHLVDKHPYMVSYFDALEASRVVPSKEVYEENTTDQRGAEGIRPEVRFDGNAK